VSVPALPPTTGGKLGIIAFFLKKILKLLKAKKSLFNPIILAKKTSTNLKTSEELF